MASVLCPAARPASAPAHAAAACALVGGWPACCAVQVELQGVDSVNAMEQFGGGGEEGMLSMSPSQRAFQEQRLWRHEFWRECLAPKRSVLKARSPAPHAAAGQAAHMGDMHEARHGSSSPDMFVTGGACV